MLFELKLPIEFTKDQLEDLVPKPSATLLSFCAQSRVLAVGMTDGSVFMFKFSLKDNLTPTVAVWPPAPVAVQTPTTTPSAALAAPPTPEIASPPNPQEPTEQAASSSAAPPALAATPAEPTAQVEQTSPPAQPQARGFQLFCQWNIGQPVSCVTIEYGLAKVAIGTYRGGSHVFNIKLYAEDGSPLKAPVIEEIFGVTPTASSSANAELQSPVVQMRFMESVLDKYGHTILVLIGRENGTIHVLNMKNLQAGAGRALTGKDAALNEANKNFTPQLLNFYVTNERGRQVLMQKRAWISDEDVAPAPAPVPSETASADSTAAPKQAASPEASRRASVSQGTANPLESWLVMVFVNCIITYRLPAFEKAELVQTKAPLAWCTPIRVTKEGQDECCLVCIDMGSNLYIHNLMSLKLIDKQYSLRACGVDTKYVPVKLPSKQWLLMDFVSRGLVCCT